MPLGDVTADEDFGWRQDSDASAGLGGVIAGPLEELMKEDPDGFDMFPRVWDQLT